VFCASLADVFDNQAPKTWRADLFRLIRETPELDWQLLTKRPQNIARMLPADWGEGYTNVWLGITAEDAERFRMRWPIVSRVPAARRFLSYEPAIAPLGTIDIRKANCLPDWIICGGESGGHARVMHPAWARHVRDQCCALGIAFFHKPLAPMVRAVDCSTVGSIATFRVSGVPSISARGPVSLARFDQFLGQIVPPRLYVFTTGGPR
jgi:protein gp37